MAEVDSLEQKQLRKKKDFGVKFKKLTQEEKLVGYVKNGSNRIKLQPMIQANTFCEIPPQKLHIGRFEPGSLVSCEVQSLLTWNRITVHLANNSYQGLACLLRTKAMEQHAVEIPRSVYFALSLFIGFIIVDRK